jgi:hypothetical protein
LSTPFTLFYHSSYHTMAIATYRREQSIHGHRLDELKSGLQKYIRRGDVDGAMYCLGDLDCFYDCGDQSKRIRTNMIHRLMIIFIEDVGLAGFTLWPVVDTLVQSWMTCREKNTFERTRVLQALVKVLCRAQKTRACSFARAYATTDSESDDEWGLLRRVLLDEKASYREYMKVIDMAPLSDRRFREIALTWVKEIKTKERTLIPILLALAYLFGIPTIPVHLENTGYDEGWELHRARPARVLDDFVYDKHVRGGNPTNEFWLNVSSVVHNEVHLVPDVFREAYIAKVRGTPKNPKFGPQKPLPALPDTMNEPKHETEHEPGNEPKHETDYKLIVRCQLVCTRLKTDTVLAENALGDMVFLKGPFRDRKVIDDFLRFQSLKRDQGLPFVESSVEYLVPDRWDSTPIGIRNKLPKNVPAPFLVCKCVFSRDRIRTRVHESKYWPPTKVLDMKAMKITVDPFSLNETQLEEYALAVCFRKQHNIGDMADRNFVLGDDGHVYSIDEEVVDTPINLETALKRKRCDLIRKWITPEHPLQ